MKQILKYQNVNLNGRLLKGRNLLNNLVSILINFRAGGYAKLGYLVKNFHQVKVRQSDTYALRLVWREQPTDEFSDCQIFSISSAKGNHHAAQIMV